MEQLAAAVRCCGYPRALASRPLPKVPALLNLYPPHRPRRPARLGSGFVEPVGGAGRGPHRRVASLRGRGGGGGPSRQQLTASPRYVLFLPGCVFKEGLFPDKVRYREFDGFLVPDALEGPVAHCPVYLHHALSWSAAVPCTFPPEQPCLLGTLQKEIALWDSPRGRRHSAGASPVQPGGFCLATVPQDKPGLTSGL